MVRELSGKEILAIYTPPDTFSVSEVTEIIPGFRVKIFDLLTFVAPSEYDAKVKEIKESLEKNGLSIDTVMIEP
jgi:ABC-type uncharacterized transport system substrate-binding protein